MKTVEINEVATAVETATKGCKAAAEAVLKGQGLERAIACLCDAQRAWRDADERLGRLIAVLETRPKTSRRPGRRTAAPKA